MIFFHKLKGDLNMEIYRACKDRAYIHKRKKKNTKHVPTNFFSTQKRTNRSSARTNKACIDLKIFQQIFQNLLWYLVVFGSRSMLLGVLLIKNSNFKIFFSHQI